MLDGWARRQIDPALRSIARHLASAGVTPNAITLAACLCGLAAAGSIALGHEWWGLALILLSRLGDGLDGAVAAIKGRTDVGGYLDIVLDFVFYGAVPLGFAIADPGANALPAAVLLFSFYANGASFLAFAILAQKHGMTSGERGPKSLFFTTGLAEATETIAVFIAFCLLPGWFAPIAYAFAVICIYTAVSRIVLAARTFG